MLFVIVGFIYSSYDIQTESVIVSNLDLSESDSIINDKNNYNEFYGIEIIREGGHWECQYPLYLESYKR
jgi:hypothetical protein